MPHAQVEVTVDGRPVAGAFYERLISLSVTDKEGVSSDTFQCELNDGPPNFLAIPKTGAEIEVKLGYRESGVRSIGKFTVDKVSGKCLPYSISISGKSADLGKGKLKESQERHWDKKKIKDIVGEIASESDLTPAVDEEIGAHEYEWVAQQDESNIHFLERLARRHNALFTIKDGRLILAKRGSGNSSTGQFVGSVVVQPENIIQGSCSFEVSDRTKYKKVKACYQDRDKAERVEVEEESDEDGDSELHISEPLADKKEAKKAAKSKAKELKRGEGTASVSVPGDTAIVAGAPLLFQNVRPGLDGVPFVIDTVTHDYSKSSGFTTKLSAKLYDGKSSKKGSDSSDDDDADADTRDSDSGDSGGDTKAPDLPSNTPKTPSTWTGTRRYGGTDPN